jgi:pilus assembly protein CpaF
MRVVRTASSPGSAGARKTVLAILMSRSAALSVEAKRAFSGLLPLIDQPELRDVMIHITDGVGKLFIDTGGRNTEVRGWQASPDAVRRLATALIAAGGRHIDELHPYADVRLGDGIRVHAMLPPLSVSGAAISIRVPQTRPMSFDELTARNLCAPWVARHLTQAVALKRNLLITGGTGTGKTTVLASLLSTAPPSERIITIEDVAELRLNHPHWVALESRQANTEGHGDVSLERLLREALRMRPDRVVLGECRGAEVLTLLSALNTGHDGGAGTLHASTLDDVPARLEALGALGGLGPAALGRQVVSALHLVAHLERSSSGHHRVAALGTFHLVDERLVIAQVAEPDHAAHGHQH